MGCVASRKAFEGYVVPCGRAAPLVNDAATFYSVGVNSPKAQRSQRELFVEEKSFIIENNQEAMDDFGDLFRKLIGQFQEGPFGINYVLSKSQLRIALERELDVKVSERVFDKLFTFFDFKNEGYVDKVEFAVACGLLTFQGSYKSTTEVAFRMFDSNHDGVISKREFTEMSLILMGYRLRTLFSMKCGKEAFMNFLKSEFNDELLRFYDEFDLDRNRQYPRRSRTSLRLRDSKTSWIPRARAVELFNQYIDAGAPQQINISQELRLGIKNGIEASNAPHIAIALFEPALYEVFQLMENDCLMRFKRKLVQSNEVLTDVVWRELGITKQYMTYRQFEEYSMETPSLFEFIDQLYESLHNEIYSSQLQKKMANHQRQYSLPDALPPKFQSFSEGETITVRQTA